jgi:hypothetical protein
MVCLPAVVHRTKVGPRNGHKKSPSRHKPIPQPEMTAVCDTRHAAESRAGYFHLPGPVVLQIRFPRSFILPFHDLDFLFRQAVKINLVSLIARSLSFMMFFISRHLRGFTGMILKRDLLKIEAGFLIPN